MSIVGLVVVLVVVALLFWIVSLLPLPASPPFLRNVLYIIVALCLIVWLLNLGGYVDLGVRLHK